MTTKRCPRRVRRPGRCRPRLEALETRCLLSAPALLSPDARFHETIDVALGLKTVGLGTGVTAAGSIGAGPQGAADVNWYEFYLPDTAEVRLTVLPGSSGRPLDAAISLYNDAPKVIDPFTFLPTDPYTPDLHRLLARDDGGVSTGPGRPATIDRLLARGTYWVAVSGSGNDYFSPYLAGSGLNGRTGTYQLSITVTDPGPGLSYLSPPVVLASDPAPGAVLGQSPFVLRFDLNAPLSADQVANYYNDPTTLAQLVFNTTNDFSPGGSATDVTQQYLASYLGALVYLEPQANELQIDLAAPLLSGFYEVNLPDFGYSVQFQVAGPAGNLDPTQQPGTWTGTAFDIANAADGRLHQFSGAVGDDPTDLAGFYQAGFQLYHLTIDQAGTYTLGAEAFAGRIGSPLNASLTLYQVKNGSPTFVASDGDTANTLPGTNNKAVLYTDPALFATLGPGDYYLAVSAAVNFPNPNDPSSTNYFDPTVPQSGSTGTAGNTTGPYVLNLLIQPAALSAPHVVAVKPDTGPDGSGPLTAVRVQFDQPVNLLALAYQRYLQTPPGATPDGSLSSVTLTNGQQTYDLRLGNYDSATNTATFILLNGVPPGQYTLALSGAGAEGIASAAGVPLAGSIPGGSTFTTSFAVTGQPPVGNDWESLPSFNDPKHAQPIGVLFPVQLSEGVTITHDASAGTNVPEADYGIDLLQSRTYIVTADGDIPPGCTITVFDANGVAEASYTYGSGNPPPPFYLSAGHYTIQVACPAGLTNYALHLSYPGTPDNPTPLVVGAGPALRVRLLTNTTDGIAPPAATAASGGSAPGATPAASSGGALPAAFALPSSGLLAQGFSPLDGVLAAGGANYTGGDRLLAHAPADTSPGNALLSLVIVTQAPLSVPSEADQSPMPALGPTAASSGQGGASVEVLTRMLDMMFEFWGWFSAPVPAPAAPGTATPAAPTDGGGGEDGLGAVLPDPRTEPAESGSDPSWGWAWALAAGVMAVSPIRPRSSGRTRRLSPRLSAGRGTEN
jgi:hypothetical protein